MKNLYIFLFTLLMVNGAMAQSCLPNGIIITTQTQIDNFQINYPSCTEIEGDLIIGTFDGSDITNLNGLSVLTAIGGSLDINNNDNLTSLTGLDNLTSVGDGVLIINGVLTSLTGLEGLISIGSNLSISDNDSLTSLTGLNNLTSIGGKVGISYNDVLTSLIGLDNVTSIGGNIEIIYNDALTSLTGFDNINANSISYIIIRNNNLLSTCNVQSICDYLANPNGSVEIYNNAIGCNKPPEVASACSIPLSCLPYGHYHFTSQDDIDNFQSDYPNCTDLNGNVHIHGDDIVELTGLSVVTSIEGNFNIGYYWEENPALTSLLGLEGLTSIGGTLMIQHNDALTSLTGLDNFIAGSYFNLSISINASLSDCAVKSICDYLASSHGPVNIWYNASGCNSEEEVETACGVGMEENNLSVNHLNIYPNPTSTIITIETTTKGQLSILNLYGQELLKQEITEPSTQINISTLLSGVYFVKVMREKCVLVGQIIKI